MPGGGAPIGGITGCMGEVIQAATTGASIAKHDELRNAFAALRESAVLLSQVSGINAMLVTRKVPAEMREAVKAAGDRYFGACARLGGLSGIAWREGGNCQATFETATTNANSLHRPLMNIMPSTETAIRRC